MLQRDRCVHETAVEKDPAGLLWHIVPVVSGKAQRPIGEGLQIDPWKRAPVASQLFLYDAATRFGHDRKAPAPEFCQKRRFPAA